MPQLRVDDEVWRWLKSKAQPFEDTPNSVLRRIAALDGPDADSSVAVTRRPRKPSPRATGKKTPQGEYRIPILQILSRHAGRADRTFVLKELERLMADRLTAHDRGDIKSGTVRWQKSAEWEISTMRQEGLLVPQANSPRGVWCLSPAGEREATALASRVAS
jgi:hypothetical protein